MMVWDADTVVIATDYSEKQTFEKKCQLYFNVLILRVLLLGD